MKGQSRFDKEAKRQDAEARAEERDSRTDQEQLDLIGKRRGNSTKETERLKKRIG
jgi:hypothetical protein